MTDVSQPADLGGADGTPKFRSGARGIIFIIGEISSRLLSAVTLIILSALTLPTLIYSVGESNNRVAAETFTAEQLARTREQIAQQMPKMIGGSSVSSDDVNQASVQVRMQILQTQENYLEALQLDLKAVSFAGSFENRNTVYALVNKYLKDRAAASIDTARKLAETAVAVEIEGERTILQGTLSSLDTELSFIDEMLTVMKEVDSAAVPNDLSDLNALIRQSTARIPIIESPRFPAEEVVQRFDFFMIQNLQDQEARESDPEVTETLSKTSAEVWDDIKRRSLADQSILNERKANVTAERSALAARIGFLLDEPAAPPVPGIAPNLGPPGYRPLSAALPEPEWAAGVLRPLHDGLSYLPTAYLFAIIGLASGAMGALFISIVHREQSPWRNFAKGVIAGFAVILIVKGGISVFSVDADHLVDAANPFSVAFLGFIAGLFTDRLFKTLESAVAGAVARANNGDGGGDQQRRPVKRPPIAK